MGILFDFNRPIGRPCQKCGYPFGNPPDRKIYPLAMNDCTEHMPPEWKYYEPKAMEGIPDCCHECNYYDYKERKANG